MGASVLPDYAVMSHKPGRAYMVLAALAAALPMLGLCYLSGIVWSRNTMTNSADVVALQRMTSGVRAAGAVSLIAAAAASPAAPAAGALGDSCQPVQKFIAPPKTRQEIPFLLESEGFVTGAELGVQHGTFAAETLWMWRNCKRYYLVDPYGSTDVQHQPSHDTSVAFLRSSVGVHGSHMQSQDPQEEAMQQAHENLQAWQHKTVWLRNTTTEAAAMLNETLDFVYLNAHKDFCGMLTDIRTWWPLVRPGGIMAGYSYENALDVLRQTGQDWSSCGGGMSAHQGAVQGAVNEFFERQGLQIVITYREQQFNSWLVRKPFYPCSSQRPAGANLDEGQSEQLNHLLSTMLQQSAQSRQQKPPTEQQATISDQQQDSRLAEPEYLAAQQVQQQQHEQHDDFSADMKQPMSIQSLQQAHVQSSSTDIMQDVRPKKEQQQQQFKAVLQKLQDRQRAVETFKEQQTGSAADLDSLSSSSNQLHSNVGQDVFGDIFGPLEE